MKHGSECGLIELHHPYKEADWRTSGTLGPVTGASIPDSRLDAIDRATRLLDLGSRHAGQQQKGGYSRDPV
ncbi:hypothetical protein DPEC_G00001570 [Dallia pectoralis]|uniref:Uncharacterized protein n=1 Tax=Dallia pectoralis TaxID=75939 RepID=A0ACC2HK87_DALPE|nr:hypothetical protein DPEC_G00001570 [Dallia pectoralis]